MNATRAVLSATGAITSVGRTASAACAAIRAGVARPRRLSGFQLVDEEAQESLLLTGHPLQGYADGFHLVGRWLRLARGCVNDLREQSSVPDSRERRFWERTGLLAVLPSVDAEVLLSEPEDVPEILREDYLLPLHRALGLPIPLEQLHLFASGHVGTAEALSRGLRGLAAGEVEQWLVVAVDSLLDPLLLGQLLEARRLKHDDQPTGLMPGEAGVCLLVERESGARGRGVAAPSLIAAVATNQVAAPDAHARDTGQALATCIRQVVEPLVSSEGPFEGELYSDLTGEEWRAREWGGALVRLGNRLDTSRLRLPCNSVGDVGAASGALGMCLVAESFAARQSWKGRALVLSSSIQGGVGAIHLQQVSP
ncbi:hypothetical protein ACN469_25985 [Corallococcus terminator]